MRSPEPAPISSSSSESSDAESDSDSDTSDPSRFTKYLKKVAQKHVKTSKDTATFTKFLATLPISKAAKRRSEETLADLAKKSKKTATSYLCVECDEPFADKDDLKKHQETCNKEEPKKNQETAEKAFPCDKCDKSYVTKANLVRHVRNKHEVSAKVSDGDRANETKTKSSKCRLCKDVRVNIYRHYGTKHKIDNVEQMLFDDSTVLVVSDIDPDNGNALWFKEQLEKASRRYIDPTCRLCEFNVHFDSSDLLKEHYTVHHNVDAKSLRIIQHLFRAEMNAHLGEADQKTKRVDTKDNVRDKKKVINKDKRQNKDNTRIIYKCKCGKATESYDASVEHSQEHLVAKYTNTEMAHNRNFAFEADIDDNSVFKVIKYDFETLLTDAWLEMFNDAPADKDRILSSSIYKYFRSVRLRSEDTDSSTGIPAYKCEMCQLFVHPAKIRLHCKNYEFCPTNKPEKHYCNVCDIHFYTKPALAYHEDNHAAGFKLVTFNNKNDVQINKILEKLVHPTDDSQEEDEEEEIEKNPKKNADGKRIEITSVYQYCKQCENYVDVSTFEAHCEAHQKEKVTYSGNVSGNNVSSESVIASNENATREVTEELTNAGQVNDEMITEDGDIPVNDHSKENDAEYTDESDSNSDCQSPIHSTHVVHVQVHINKSVDENATDVENVGSPEKVLREIFGANESQASMSCNEELQSTQELQQIFGNDDTDNENNEGRGHATEVSQDIFSEDITQEQNKGSAEASMTNNEVSETNKEGAQDTVQLENEEGIIRTSSKEIINELISDEDMELDRDEFLKLNAMISMTLYSRD